MNTLNYGIDKIFVIGRNRSGTKWISNIIANHPDVACIQREGAGGIVESNLFYELPKLFGSLHYIDNFIAFIEIFSMTNFFKITGLNKNVLYKGPRDYLDFLCYVLDLYALKKKKKFWLQKTNTIKFKDIYNRYPNAQYIAILRDPIDNIKSNIGLKKGSHIRSGKKEENFSKGLLREIISYTLEKKNIEQFSRKKNVILVNFDDLKNDKEETIKKICKFLNIGFNKDILKDKYKKNTSFNGKISRDKILNTFDIIIIKILYKIFSLFPRYFFTIIFSYHEKRIDRNQISKFLPRSFEYKIDELNDKGIKFTD